MQFKVYPHVWSNLLNLWSVFFELQMKNGDSLVNLLLSEATDITKKKEKKEKKKE